MCNKLRLITMATKSMAKRPPKVIFEWRRKTPKTSPKFVFWVAKTRPLGSWRDRPTDEWYIAGCWPVSLDC